MSRLFGAGLLYTMLFGVSSAAIAAEEQAKEPPSNAVLIVLLVPAVLLVGWLIVFTRKSGAMRQGGYLAKAGEHMDMSVEYMKRMEQKTDRMIQLLESIDRQLRNED